MPNRRNILLNRKIDLINQSNFTVDGFEDFGGYYFKYFPQESTSAEKITASIPKSGNDYALGWEIEVSALTDVSYVVFTPYAYDPLGTYPSGAPFSSITITPVTTTSYRGQVLRSDFNSGNINFKYQIFNKFGYYGALVGDSLDATITFSKYHVYLLYS